MSNKDIVPFVSIIIPAYNEERFIRQCLDSVLSQEWPQDKMEVIVVDNGSIDNTVNIAGEVLKASGRGVVLEKPAGTIASVRNFGWHHSRGELLAFLDGDSIVDACWLKMGHDLLLKFEESSCVGFAVAPPLASASWVERTWYPISSSGKHHGTKVVSWLSTFNIIIKRESFESVKGFDESLVTCEDVDLGNRLSLFSEMIFSDICKVGHLGNVANIVDFFKKEIWRGQNSFRQFANSNNKIKDILSLILPPFYLISFLLFIFILLFPPDAFNYYCLSLGSYIIVFPVILSLRAGTKTFKQLCSTSCLYFVYLLARGMSFVPKLR